MMALFSRLIMLVLVLAVSPAWAHPIWTNEPSGMTAILVWNLRGLMLMGVGR